MRDWQSQAGVRWKCKDHVVILPKYRTEISSRTAANKGDAFWQVILGSRVLREYGGVR
jgi:hypothetical protein